jgi:NadR type nicotinamide-nucleotide adenylyltransferase
MLLGKFMPPHLGHLYLGEFAHRYVDELTIVVCSIPGEPIPGGLRFDWMRELFPFDRVVHLTDDLPQDPKDHPGFWPLWRASLNRVLPAPVDYVFASEAYGLRLARELGAEFVPVDVSRSAVPVSGTAVRTDPVGFWDFIPRCVRPYFLRRVCVFGPESTGKTTLARRLAAHFGTVMVPEYARALLESQGGRIASDDILRIARGQRASEDALARNARGLLVCDTDLLTTLIWSDALFGSCPEWVQREADRRTYDRYLLLDVDVKWVPDPVRYLPDDRAAFFDRCRRALDQRGRPYVVLSGDWEQRFAAAVAAVEPLLRPHPRPEGAKQDSPGQRPGNAVCLAPAGPDEAFRIVSHGSSPGWT